MSDTFLTPDEVGELTGIKRAQKGVSRGARQASWLASRGIPVILNEAGRAIVARAALTDRKAQPKRQWASNALQH